jgi:capsule polysaccharide export protein KpsE/RkpR
MSSRGSSSSQSSGLTPHVSHIHLNYEAMENQLRMTQDVLTAEQEDHRETRESLTAYNAQMQAFMTVRNKNTFIDFITFSNIYVC